MKKIILVRIGEIVLKGLNRHVFEERLISNMKKAIHDLGKADISNSQSRIYVDPQGADYDFDEAMERLTKVFGIVSVSPVWRIDSDFEEIKKHSLQMVNDLLERKDLKTFKVGAKRGSKRFHMDSPEICRDLGEYLLDSIPSLSVDIHNPDFIIYVEVRESSYIYSEIILAQGGMPIGSNGKAALLISGGIDSPVAGWMIAKRGVTIEAVHFYSYPYTSERAKEKVIELTKILAAYCHQINLHVVPFTEIQLAINEKCPQDESTIIMRRAMMIIAERIANSVGALALITGESVGQVASQTLESLAVTNAVVTMPVFRPLIGMDKNEVIDIARKIGTFETSILPYEDCCTVFVAKHPKTKPRLKDIISSESHVLFDDMYNTAIQNTEIIEVKSIKDNR